MPRGNPPADKKQRRPIPSLRPLGRQVRRLRLERDLALDVVAHDAGFSSQYLGDIESGRVNAGILSLIALARVFGVTVSKLVETTGENAVEEQPPLPRTRATRRPKSY